MSDETRPTYRTAVALPEMPDELELLDRYPPLTLHRAELDGDRLRFGAPDEFDASLERGFFLLRIPAGTDLGAADRFAAHFHEPRAGDGDRDDAYRGFAAVEVPGDYQGYFAREHDQWENFYVERTNWGLLPAGVAAAGGAMARAGIAVLRAVLERIGVPRDVWDEVTGGLTTDGGHQMLAVNHFRPERPVRGSKFHRDSGWVTVLRSTEPGLLALVGDELRSVVPEPGNFVINFGSSIEVLTERMRRPVRANVHGVAGTRRAPGQPHRTSYVTFLDSRLDGTIYRGDGDAIRPVQTVADFAAQEVARTYDATTDL